MLTYPIQTMLKRKLKSLKNHQLNNNNNNQTTVKNQQQATVKVKKKKNI
jgi:hypothetical protein